MGNSIEKTGKFYYGEGITKRSGSKDDLLLENVLKKQEVEKAAKEASQILLEAKKAKQKELEERLKTLEMLPIGSKVVILPYPENPYKKVITESGILIDYDGSFKNPDSGEQDKLKQGIQCAKVIEVGPDCKVVRLGDDVFYESRATAPLPFFSLGYEVLVEGNIFVILNEGLQARLKE